VLDFSDPANIGTQSESTVTNTVTSVASLALPGTLCGISYRGDELLVGSYSKGFSRVNISSKLAPQLVDHFEVAGRTLGAFFSEDGSLILSASGKSGVYIFEKETLPLDPTPIETWGYNQEGDFVMTLSLISGNLELEYSLDAQQWAAVSSAQFQGLEVSVPAEFFAGKKNVYFRVKQWQ
jgi:hypothetical protein